MKLDLTDKLLLNFDGSPVMEQSADGSRHVCPMLKYLTDIMGAAPKQGENSIKIYEMGCRLAVDHALELDTTDWTLLDSVIRETPLYGPIVTGQLRKELLKVKPA